jgi:membrane protein DedA with SNARE-associated domain
MEEIITSISTYGYVIIALYSFGGGMIAIIAGSVLASMGELDILTVLLVAGISNMFGDIFLFYFGKNQKSEIKKYQFVRRNIRKLAYSRILVSRNDILAIFIQKYLYGVKTLIPLILGVSNYNFKKFATLNFFSTILWTLSIGLTTYFSAEVVRVFLDENSIPAYILPIFFLVFLVSVWGFLEYKTKKRPKSNLPENTDY